MRKLRICNGLAAIAALYAFSAPALAQDDDNGPISQGDDAQYLSLTFVEFKAGRREQAMQLIAEHFVPATEKAGTAPPLMAIHFQTGKWDAAFVWVLEGGMADLEWYRSPDDVKWFAALAELEGGVEEAEAVWKQFTDTIKNSVTEVGHHHIPESD